MKHIVSIVLLAAALTLVSPSLSLADDTNRTAVTQVLDTLSGSVLPKEEMSAAKVSTQTLDWVGAESRPSRMPHYPVFPQSVGRHHCPVGYRLHYQGLCINIADELSDDSENGVRMTDPIAVR